MVFFNCISMAFRCPVLVPDTASVITPLWLIQTEVEQYRDQDQFYVTHFSLQLKLMTIYYRPQLLLREGNVFTSVCQEFCSHVIPSPRQTPTWADTPSLWILRDTVNKRAVRILLECILVLFVFTQTGPGLLTEITGVCSFS